MALLDPYEVANCSTDGSGPRLCSKLRVDLLHPLDCSLSLFVKLLANAHRTAGLQRWSHCSFGSPGDLSDRWLLELPFLFCLGCPHASPLAPKHRPPELRTSNRHRQPQHFSRQAWTEMCANLFKSVQSARQSYVGNPMCLFRLGFVCRTKLCST